MKKRHRMILTALLSGSLLIAACSPSTKTATPDANLVITQAAMTVAAQLTQSAALTPKPTNPPLPTETSAAPAATPTTPPTAQATAAPAPTNTTAPDAPPSAANDAASFVADVSIPDGTVIAPGANFVKTWRIKNNGVTTWNTSYTILFIDGEKMGSPDSVAMPKEVKPGETVEISVKLTAPAKTGSYQAFYRLRNAGGQFFHLDQSGDLWLKITVGTPSSSATATPSTTETADPATTVTAAPTNAD